SVDSRTSARPARRARRCRRPKSGRQRSRSTLLKPAVTRLIRRMAVRQVRPRTPVLKIHRMLLKPHGSPSTCTLERELPSLRPWARDMSGAKRLNRGGLLIPGGDACWLDRVEDSRCFVIDVAIRGERRRAARLYGLPRAHVPAGATHSQRDARKGYVMSFIKKHALAIGLAAGLSQGVALSQSPLLQTESSLSRNPAL